MDSLQHIIQEVQPRNTNLIQVGQLLVSPGKCKIRENQIVELVWIDNDKFAIIGNGFSEITWSVLKPSVIKIIDLPRICGRNIVQKQDLSLTTRTEKQRKIVENLNLNETVKCTTLYDGSCWIKNPYIYLNPNNSYADLYYIVSTELFGIDSLIPVVGFTNPSTLKKTVAFNFNIGKNNKFIRKEKPIELQQIDHLFGYIDEHNFCIESDDKFYWQSPNVIKPNVNSIIEPNRLKYFLESCGVDSEFADSLSSPIKRNL